MFRKLRNKFILFNFGITSVVILIVFSLIFVTASHSAERRPPIEPNAPSYTTDIRKVVTQSIQDERENASKDLLSILITSGIAIEVCVILISYFLAEVAIKPVKEAYESQKLFIANASHEIKTPLAAISANLEAANLSDNKWIKNVEEETKKITTLNSSLLTLARTDLISEKQETSRVDLKELLEKELKAFTPRLKSSNKKIELIKNLNSSTKELNKTDLCEVINILLDNAIKYCKSKIIISANESKIEIQNDGKLIPNDKLPHIFDRFYQVDKSSDGVGLGLSIAQSIATSNKWQIEAKTDDEFNIFTIEL